MSESRRRSARKREDKSYVECPDIVIGTLPIIPSPLLAISRLVGYVSLVFRIRIRIGFEFNRFRSGFRIRIRIQVSFWSLKSWIRIGFGSGSVFSLKCWIRIKWLRIQNTALSYQSFCRCVFLVAVTFLHGKFVTLSLKSFGFFNARL